MIKYTIGIDEFEFPTRPSEVTLDLFLNWADGTQTEIIAAALKCDLSTALKISKQQQIEMLNSLIPLIESLSYEKTYSHAVTIGNEKLGITRYETKKDILAITFGTYEKISFQPTVPLQLAQYILGHEVENYEVEALAEKIKQSPAVEVLPFAFFFGHKWNALQKYAARLTHRRTTPMQFQQDLASLLIGSGGITRVTTLQAHRLN